MKILQLMVILFLQSAMLNTQTISSKFPFEHRFLEVQGSKLHYIDTGRGDPILFLHGIPMWSYSWRNVIPHLVSKGRCIAVDFMGFGLSDKPNIDYSFQNQLDYLEAFIAQLNLDDITLVMTDIGGILGTKYASLHPKKIKALVFMEMPLGNAETFHRNGGMMQRMMFWMAGKNKLGYNKIVKRNIFLKMMPMLIKRKLTAEEKAHYVKPFATRASRKPLFVMPNSFPRKGRNEEPGDMADFTNQNASYLVDTDVPKLFLYAKPGMLGNKKARAWAESNLTNIQLECVGKAKHLMEEDLPHEIGRAILKWIQKGVQ